MVKDYAGYTQYKLIEVYPTEKITYRRGNSYNNFLHRILMLGRTIFVKSIKWKRIEMF